MRTLIRTGNWRAGSTRKALAAVTAVAMVAALSACSSSDSATPGTGTSTSASGSAGAAGSATASGSGTSAAAGSSSEAAASGETGAGADATGADSTSSPVPVPPVPGAEDTGPAALQGLTFVATEVSGSRTIAPGSTITLAFNADGTLSARGGCNNMSGGFTVDGDVLNVATMASTMMACEQALMDQDTWLAAFLASSPTWTYTDSVLTLTNGTDTMVMSAPVAGPGAVDATGWTVVGLIAKTADASSVSAVDPSLDAWIRFSAGEAVINTSCNTGRGVAEVGGTSIIWGPLATTLVACDGASGTTEQAMLAVLQGETNYSLTDDAGGTVMVIMSADDTQGLQLTSNLSVGADAFASAAAQPTG